MQNISRNKNLVFRDTVIAEQVSNRVTELHKSGIKNKTHIARVIMSEFKGAFSTEETARSYVRVKLGYIRSRGRLPKETDTIYVESDDFRLAKTRQTEVSHRYIITWAQNNTPVFISLWENILAYADVFGAVIHVIAGRYKNPTSIFSDKKEEKWDKIIRPYLDASEHQIHDMVRIVSNIKIQPTNSNPLNGMESVAKGKTCVFGHPRVHMKTLPTVYGNGINGEDVYKLSPQFLFTTGAITVADYTDSNIGAKGVHHHTYGFVIVEILSDGTYRIRQVKACSDGSFTDLFWRVSDGCVSYIDGVNGIVFGDIHASKLSLLSINRIISMIEQFSPEYSVLHDVFDGESINPHEKDDPIRQYLRKKQGDSSLLSEINNTIDIINVLSEISNIVIVNSNHDYFLEKYIKGNDWKRDIDNAPEYMRYALAMLEGKVENGLFSYIVNEMAIDKKKITCLGVDESFIIGGRECGQHGHLGVSGTKGSPSQFRRFSSKNIIGHTHSPQRIDGLTVVGCQDIFHSYNKGASNWWMCDVLIHHDGKDQQILHLGQKLTEMEL